MATQADNIVCRVSGPLFYAGAQYDHMASDSAWSGVGNPSGMVNHRAADGTGLTIFGEWPTNIASGTDVTYVQLVYLGHHK